MYLAIYTAILKKRNRNYKLRSQGCLGFAAETSKANDGHHMLYQSAEGKAHTTGVEWKTSTKRCPASSRYKQSRNQEYSTETRYMYRYIHVCSAAWKLIQDKRCYMQDKKQEIYLLCMAFNKFLRVWSYGMKAFRLLNRWTCSKRAAIWWVCHSIITKNTSMHQLKINHLAMYATILKNSASITQDKKVNEIQPKRYKNKHNNSIQVSIHAKCKNNAFAR